MKYLSFQIESQIGKVLLQATETNETPMSFRCCRSLVQYLADTKPRDARYKAPKCFIVAEVLTTCFLEVSGAI